MVSPNFELFLWILLIVELGASFCRIMLGLLEAEKSTKYGAADVLNGIFWIIVILIVLLL